jgi:hypothetical protein
VIEKLDAAIENSTRCQKYKSHYKAILNWVITAVKEEGLAPVPEQEKQKETTKEEIGTPEEVQRSLDEMWALMPENMRKKNNENQTDKT